MTLTGVGNAERKTGTVLVFCEDGKWKACVNDRDEGYYAFVSSDTAMGLLGALEKGLQAGLDWRKSKGYKGR